MPPTMPALMSTYMVIRKVDEKRSEIGTMFRIAVDGREYWITARHVVTGGGLNDYGKLDGHTIDLGIINDQGLSTEHSFSMIDLGEKVDVIVLYAAQALLPASIAPMPLGAEGAVLGGECAFLGFGLGAGWRAPFANGTTKFMPFVKRCTIAGSQEAPLIWILDGINNHGFSGGPVLVGEGAQQRIMAVISGYLNEKIPLTVGPLLPNGVPPSSAAQLTGTADANSGLILAFDIKVALDGIRANPVGPNITPAPQ